MPMKKGHSPAPQNMFIESVIKKYDQHPNRNFLIGNANIDGCPIIYCNSGFCELTGFQRHEVVQKSCICDFLNGEETDEGVTDILQNALINQEEVGIQTIFYKKSGEKFLCNIAMIPVRNESRQVGMFVVNLKDVDDSLAEDEKKQASVRKISQIWRGIKRKTSSNTEQQDLQPTPQQQQGEIVNYWKSITNHSTKNKKSTLSGFASPLSTSSSQTDDKTDKRPTKLENLHIQKPDGNHHLDNSKPSITIATENLMPFKSRNFASIVKENLRIKEDQSTKLPPSKSPTLPSIATPNSEEFDKREMTSLLSDEDGLKETKQICENIPLMSLGNNGDVGIDNITNVQIPFVSISEVSDERDDLVPQKKQGVFLRGTDFSKQEFNRLHSSSLIDLPSNENASKHYLDVPQTKMRYSTSEGDLMNLKFNQTKGSSIGLIHCDDESTSFHMSLRSLKTIVKPQTQKVAQVMSLGSDIMPEYKVESPKIHPWTILHYSPFKAIWDWVVLFLVMYTAIITPYMAAFVLTKASEENGHDHSSNAMNMAITDDPLVILDYIVDVMFIIDIFINFRTTFVDAHDEVVSDPCRIAVNYMKGWFVVDLLAAIPFELLIMIGNTDQTTTLIGLLKTARLLRLVRVARKLDRYSEYGTALLLLLMFGFALVAHWLACVWYAIGNFERENNELSWLMLLGEQTGQEYNVSIGTSGPNMETKYLTALYFTLSSLTSVGFGNISANTNGERIFAIIVMLIGALMHAVIFGNVTAIIQRLYSGMAHYHSTMRRVREFIRFYQIPSPLRQRLEDYAQYDYSYTNGIDMNEVLQNFPEGLQADISLHLNRHLLSSNPAFRGCTPGCLRSLSLKLVTTHCPPGDYIIHHGDEISSLWWIGRGTVEIIQNDTIIAILGKGDSFGENFGLTSQLLTGKSKASVRALTYCDLHSISKDSLMYIMAAYPEFRKTFNADLHITYDLRDIELEEKYTHSSSSNLCNTPQPLYSRKSSRTYERIYSPKRVGSSPRTDHTYLDSVSENYSDVATFSSKNKKSVSVNNNNQCACSDLRREMDDLKLQLHRIEAYVRKDMRSILQLLEGKSTSEDNIVVENNNKNNYSRNSNSVESDNFSPPPNNRDNNNEFDFKSKSDDGKTAPLMKILEDHNSRM